MTFYIDQIKTHPLSGCVTPVYQTYHTSHMLGQCYKCPEKPVVYLNTPKCASSFMKTMVLDLNWELGFLNLGPKEIPEDNNKYSLEDIEKIIVVMRDPYDRWLTGMAEYFWEHFDHDTAFKLVENLDALKLITKQVVFDDHTESQLFFLQNIPLEKCVFFRMETNLRETFSGYLDKNLNIKNNIDSQKPLHTSTDNNFHGKFKKHLDRLVTQDHVYFQEVRRYYLQDYEFIGNMVEFYGN